MRRIVPPAYFASLRFLGFCPSVSGETVAMIEALIIVILLVHLHLEYRIWIRKETDVFRKYRAEDGDPMKAAKWAYYTKALWLIVLILMQYFGIGFRDALVYSFSLYALMVFLTLHRNLYTVTQLVFAALCLGLRIWSRLGS